MATAGAAKGNRNVVVNEFAAEAGEDGRAVGEARAVLLADAGRRTPDASAVRCDVATDRAVAPAGKLTMIARPVNRIAEEKGGGKSVREIDKKGSRLRGRVQCGTESLCFSTAIAALRGHTAEERYNLCEPGPKKEIPV